MDVDCSISNDFGAMCLHFDQEQPQEIQQGTDKQGASSNYMYTCQCPYGFGFENCTKASDEQNPQSNPPHPAHFRTPRQATKPIATNELLLVLLDLVEMHLDLLDGNFTILVVAAKLSGQSFHQHRHVA